MPDSPAVFGGIRAVRRSPAAAFPGRARPLPRLFIGRVDREEGFKPALRLSRGNRRHRRRVKTAITAAEWESPSLPSCENGRHCCRGEIAVTARPRRGRSSPVKPTRSPRFPRPARRPRDDDQDTASEGRTASPSSGCRRPRRVQRHGAAVAACNDAGASAGSGQGARRTTWAPGGSTTVNPLPDAVAPARTGTPSTSTRDGANERSAYARAGEE